MQTARFPRRGAGGDVEGDLPGDVERARLSRRSAEVDVEGDVQCDVERARLSHSARVRLQGLGAVPRATLRG